MTPDELSALLTATTLPDTNPDVAALVAGGEGVRRRRTRRALAGVVAAVVVVVAGALAVPQLGGRSVSSPAPATPATYPEPAGMRLIGRGRLVVAVPDSWKVAVASPCIDTSVDVVSFGYPPSPTVCGDFFDRGTTRLLVTDHGQDKNAITTTRIIDGVPVDMIDGYYCDSVLGCPGLVSAPSEDAYLSVFPTPRYFTASARILPQGWTTVPWPAGVPTVDEVRAELTAAGLHVNVVEGAATAGVAPGGIVAADPVPGGVVAVGGTVTLTVAPGPTAPQPPTGNRWVGVGQDVVAIPDAWRGAPAQEQDELDMGRYPLASEPAWHGQLVGRSETFNESGTPSAARCNGTICRIEVTGSLELTGDPDHRRELERIARTLTTLPEPATTVPVGEVVTPQMAASLLHHHGLIVQTAEVDAATAEPGTLVGIQPGYGEVVASGGTATISVASPASGSRLSHDLPRPAPFPTLPPDLTDLGGRAAGIVDAHDDELAGEWYTPRTHQVVVAASSARGEALLRRTFGQDGRVRIVRRAHSLLDLQAACSVFHPWPADSSCGASPHADGIVLEVDSFITVEQVTRLRQQAHGAAVPAHVVQGP